MYPAINSDSASPKSKGIRPVSKKNIMHKNGSTGSNNKTDHVHDHWNETIWKKEKDSNKIRRYIIRKLSKTSKLSVVIKTLVEDIIAYLFLVTHPTKNNKKEKTVDKTDINNKLYSISQTAKLGPQTKFNQKR